MILGEKFDHRFMKCKQVFIASKKIKSIGGYNAKTAVSTSQPVVQGSAEGVQKI